MQYTPNNIPSVRCPDHPASIMGLSQFRSKGQQYLYCSQHAAPGRPQDKNGRCIQRHYLNGQESPQAAPTPVPSPAVAVQPPSPSPGNLGVNRTTLACAALQAACRLATPESGINDVIAVADRLLHGFLLRAAQGMPPDLSQDADIGF